MTMWLIDDEIARLIRERDDANERARLAVVRADIVQRERDEARASESALRERMAVCPKCGSTTHYKYPDPPDAAFMKLYQKYEALFAVLRDVEWVPAYQRGVGDYVDTCPLCGAWKDGLGHTTDCRLAAALEGV